MKNTFPHFKGQGIHGSSVVQGMVFKRNVEGDITKAENCKVAVYSCPLDVMQTETKVGKLAITKNCRMYFYFSRKTKLLRRHWKVDTVEFSKQ